MQTATYHSPRNSEVQTMWWENYRCSVLIKVQSQGLLSLPPREKKNFFFGSSKLFPKPAEVGLLPNIQKMVKVTLWDTFFKFIYFNWRMITISWWLWPYISIIVHWHMCPLHPVNPLHLPHPSLQVITEHGLCVPCIKHQTPMATYFFKYKR